MPMVTIEVQGEANPSFPSEAFVYQGLAVDSSLDPEFWYRQPYNQIGIGERSFTYKTTVCLLPGPHYVEYATNSDTWIGKIYISAWTGKIYINGQLVAQGPATNGHPLRANFTVTQEGGGGTTPTPTPTPPAGVPWYYAIPAAAGLVLVGGVIAYTEANKRRG